MSLTNQENWPFGRLIKAFIWLKLKPRNYKEEILKFKSCLHWHNFAVDGEYHQISLRKRNLSSSQRICLRAVNLVAARQLSLLRLRILQWTSIDCCYWWAVHTDHKYIPSGQWIMKDKGKSYICLCDLKDIPGMETQESCFGYHLACSSRQINRYPCFHELNFSQKREEE